MAVTDVEVVGTRDGGANLNAKRVQLEPDGTWIGPVGHIAAERQRLTDLEWQHFTVTQLASTLGAEIHGLDLSAPLGDEVMDELRQAWADYKVLFFRDQELTGEQHVAFAASFGELEVHPFIPGNKQLPELVRFEKGCRSRRLRERLAPRRDLARDPVQGRDLARDPGPRHRRRHAVQ